MRLLEREIKEGTIFVRVLHGQHLREPDNEREKRIILWKKL